MITKNVLNLDSNLQAVDQARTVNEQLDENLPLPISLQIFYD